MQMVKTSANMAILSKLRSRKGFSLIEMAIVLVIIGIIIAAIIKGQDLMVNSRAKQLITAANSWKASVYAYTDRNGRFPGDGGDKNGVIGDQAAIERAAGGTTSAIGEIVATLPSAPANPIIVGGQSFWFYIGNTPASDPAAGTRNAIVICKSKDCTALLSGDDVELLKTLDTAIDGNADGGKGQVRAITTAPIPATIITTLTAISGRDNGVAIAPATVDTSAAGAALPWSVAQYGAIWAFDKPY